MSIDFRGTGRRVTVVLCWSWALMFDEREMFLNY